MAGGAALQNPQWRSMRSPNSDWREVEWHDGRWTATSPPPLIETSYELRRWDVDDLPPMPDQEGSARSAARVGEPFRDVDWLSIADLSARAALSRPRWTLSQWRALGHRELRREEDHLGFDALLRPPICVGEDGWLDGTIRATLMIAAGARAFAAEHPTAVREYISPGRGAR